MTLLAQVKNIPLYYSFEGSEELIHFPPGILQFNWLLLEQLMYASDLITRIGKEKMNQQSHPEFTDLLQFLEQQKIILLKKGRYQMHSFGKYIWEIGEVYRDQYGRNVFGYHVESQVFDFLYDQLEAQFYFHKGIYIEQKLPSRPGAETDILMIAKAPNQVKQKGEVIHQPMSPYTIVECKSMWGFVKGQTYKLKKQFKSKLQLLVKHWHQQAPAEIWIVMWCFQLNEQLTFQTIQKAKREVLKYQKLLEDARWNGFFKHTKLRIFTYRFQVDIKLLIDDNRQESNVKKFMKNSIDRLYLENEGEASLAIEDMELWFQQQ